MKVVFCGDFFIVERFYKLPSGSVCKIGCNKLWIVQNYNDI